MASTDRRSLAMVGLITLAGACGGPPFVPDGELRGRWGGEGFGLNVSSHAASAVFTCAHGTLETPVVLDFARRFSAEGEYVREVGPAALRNPARYEGRVRGSVLELSVLVTDTIGAGRAYTVGPFSGTRDGTPHVFSCQ